MSAIFVHYAITDSNGEGYTPRIKLSLRPTMGSSLEDHMKSHMEGVIASTGLTQKCEVMAQGHDCLKVVVPDECSSAIEKAISDVPKTTKWAKSFWKNASEFTISDAPFITEFCEVATL
ncbi:hypothetical protein NKR23_g12337 [Pleurostoma richardsiae]|uniref:Uncharacterized protein n=1 Tax=Pleurostoma richardsiae TaxID=41990 RepID=A0AA38VFL9_9PEZI|nr:hypothetical protein NKR23_g12337 [Pleurostoma richardsiae]